MSSGLHMQQGAVRPARLSEELRWFVEAEAAARQALDRAMLTLRPDSELEWLRARWIAANDQLGYAIKKKPI